MLLKENLFFLYQSQQLRLISYNKNINKNALYGDDLDKVFSLFNTEKSSPKMK